MTTMNYEVRSHSDLIDTGEVEVSKAEDLWLDWVTRIDEEMKETEGGVAELEFLRDGVVIARTTVGEL